MSRSYFGQWGLGLSDERFAMALVAYGVLAQYDFPDVKTQKGIDFIQKMFYLQWKDGPRILRWMQKSKFGELKTLPPAEAMADVWESLTSWRLGMLTLQVVPPDDERFPFIWVLEQLSQAQGVASAYVQIADSGENIAWSWPVSFGLLADPDSRSRAPELEAAGLFLYRELPLVNIVNLQASSPRCNILILPWALSRAIREVYRQGFTIRADVVWMLGGIDEPWHRAKALLEALRIETRANGVLLAAFPFKSFVAELSHNLPLNRAVHEAARREKRPYVLLAEDRLLQQARLGTVLQKMALKLEGMKSVRKMTVHPLAATHLALPPEGSPREISKIIKLATKPMAGEFHLKSETTREMAAAADIGMAADMVAPRRDRDIFDHEFKGATSMAALSMDISGAAMNLPPAQPEPRWLQAQVAMGRDEAEKTVVTDALRAGEDHQVTVRIGPEPDDKTWLLPPRKEGVFPEHLLPEDEEIFHLQLVFSEPIHIPEPLIGTIDLPRARGESSPWTFAFTPKPSQPRFSGRLIVLHKNRVLQTATLCAEVLQEGEKALPGEEIRLVTENVVRAELSGLSGRPAFGMALVATKDSPETSSVTKVWSSQARVRKLSGGQQKNVSEIKNILVDVADNPDQYTGAKSDGTRQLLVSLAIAGGKLYTGIIEDQFHGPPDASLPIQVVTANEDAFLPVEFFYDRPSPKSDASVCECWEKCPHLAGDAVCPMDDEIPNDRVCPLGFWCLSRVIERASFQPDAVGEDEYQLMAEPAMDRQILDPFTAVLCGASKRVEAAQPGLIRETLSKLKTVIGQKPATADTWDKWKVQIKACHPGLLYIMPHTVEDKAYKSPAMEIGAKNSKTLASIHITTQHVTTEPAKENPLVLLLGCETQSSPLAYDSLVSYFRRRGAALVVCTLASILGRHAAPMGQLLVEVLKRESSKKPVAFGEVMRHFRCEALQQGYPAAMCLATFGDAHWLIKSN